MKPKLFALLSVFVFATGAKFKPSCTSKVICNVGTEDEDCCGKTCVKLLSPGIDGITLRNVLQLAGNGGEANLDLTLTHTCSNDKISRGIFRLFFPWTSTTTTTVAPTTTTAPTISPPPNPPPPPPPPPNPPPPSPSPPETTTCRPQLLCQTDADCCGRKCTLDLICLGLEEEIAYKLPDVQLKPSRQHRKFKAIDFSL